MTSHLDLLVVLTDLYKRTGEVHCFPIEEVRQLRPHSETKIEHLFEMIANFSADDHLNIYRAWQVKKNDIS